MNISQRLFFAGKLLAVLVPARVKHKDSDKKQFSTAFVVCGVMLAALSGSGARADSLSDRDADNLRNLILISGVAVAGYHRDVQGLRQYASALFTTSATTFLAKSPIDSERPNGQDNDSFPSGHVATAFAGAGFLHRRYGLRAGLPAYLAATTVAWSRVDNDHHRWGDVAAGGLIALLVNHHFVSARIPVSAQISTTNAMLALRFRF